MAHQMLQPHNVVGLDVIGRVRGDGRGKLLDLGECIWSLRRLARHCGRLWRIGEMPVLVHELIGIPYVLIVGGLARRRVAAIAAVASLAACLLDAVRPYCLVFLSHPARVARIDSVGSLTTNPDPTFPWCSIFGPVYPASKTALNGITVAMAIELEPENDENQDGASTEEQQSRTA